MLIAFALLAALVAPAAPQETPGEDSARSVLDLPTVREPDQLEARDRRLSFSRTSADRARLVLDGAPERVLDRAIAVMALGASHSGRDRFRMESIALDGAPVERRGAILALGELGATGVEALLRVLAGNTAGVEDVLCLAFVQASEKGAGPELLERLRELGTRDSELGRAATRFMAFAEGGALPEDTRALETFYALRWEAACEYGFIDGQRWKTLLIETLLGDQAYLDEVILQAALVLDPAAVRDHLLEILFTGGRPGALRAAVVAMPDVLAELVRRGVWRPGAPSQWRLMLEEVERRRLETKADALLEYAYLEVPAVADQAGVLLLRAGRELPWEWVAKRLAGEDLELRQRLILASADRNELERIPDLVALLARRTSPELYGVLVVALARLGHGDAQEELENQLASKGGLQRRQVVEALADSIHDGRMVPFAEALLAEERLDPEIRLTLELGMAERGRVRDRAFLRTYLVAAELHPARAAVVRALANRAEPEDLELFERLFPVEDDLQLNIELGVALIRAGHPAAQTLLRGALWDDAWNRSVLAGGLMVKAHGERALLDELEAPPPKADGVDLRRVGFALGEWCDLGAVEVLALRLNERDPALQGALLGALSTRTR